MSTFRMPGFRSAVLLTAVLAARSVAAFPGPCTVSPSSVAGIAWTPGNGAILCDGTYTVSSFTVAAGTTVYTLDGSTIVIKAATTIEIAGTLSADGAGALGGQVSGSYGNAGLNGSGSGGGTGGQGGSSLYAGGQGGGGGGFGGTGGTGGSGSNQAGNPSGGWTYDTGNSVTLPQTTGSGGGGGGTGGNVFSFDSAGVGGNGGGSLALLAPHIIIDDIGVVSANGTGGALGDAGGSGGGGSGGDILLEAAQGITNYGTVAANGGPGANGSGASLNQGGGGGGGGGGRIKTHTSWFCTGGTLSTTGASGGSDSVGTFGDSSAGGNGASGSSSCVLDSAYFVAAYSGSTSLSPSGSPNPVGATFNTTISANPTNPGQYQLQYQYDCTGTGSSYSASTTATSYLCSWNTIGAHTVLVRATAYNAVAFPGTPAGTQLAFSVPAASTTVTVRDVPVVSVSGPGSGHIGTAVTPLIGSFSDVVPGSSPTTWSWTFGDGSSTSVNSTVTTNMQSHVYTEPAAYTVGLTVTDNSGAAASNTTTVTIADVAPTVTIGALPPTQNATLSATFSASAMGIAPSANAAGFAYTFAWGDGSSSPVAATAGNGAGVSASHVYATPGSYTLTVSALDKYGQAGSASKAVTVINPVPFVQISAANSVPIETTFQPSVTATNGYASSFTFVLNWGDGQMTTQSGSSPQPFSHVYSVPGSYTLRVTATDSTGATNTATLAMTVSDVVPSVTLEPPSPAPVTAATSSTFTASASSISPAITGAGYSFVFDWGDGSTHSVVAGSPEGATGVVSHTYAEPGTYTLTVTATDEYGGSGSNTLPVSVADAPPTAGFTSPSYTGAAASPLTVSVTASSPSSREESGGFTYALNWGDGHTSSVTSVPGSTVAAATHTYDAGGTYTISLYVVDSLNTQSATVTASATIANVAPTITSFTHPNGYVTTPTAFAVQVSDVSHADTQAGFTIAWDFGDGTAVQSGLNLSSVTHQYTKLGSFTVRVTATDENGLEATASALISVQDQQPVVSLGSARTVGINVPATFAPTLTPDVASWTYTYAWVLGTSTSAATPTVTETFASVGTYTVSVTVTDPFGKSGSASVTVHVVDEPPVATNVLVSPASPVAQQPLTLTYAYSDPNGFTENGTTITWFANGQGVAAYNGQSMIPAGVTQRNQTWYAVVTPKDGTLSGTSVQSNTVTISDPPPEVQNVTLTPTVSYAYAGIYPENGTAISWARNGSVQSALANQRTAPAPLGRGDTWVVTVTPSDGTSRGTPQSTSVVIQDTAPALGTLSTISQNATGLMTSVSWTISATDVDGDAVTVDCAIGSHDLGAGPSYTTTVPLGTTTVTCTASDGTLTTTGSFQIVINDVPPTVTLTPNQTVDPGNITLTATASDPFGRALTYAWTIQSGPAGAQVIGSASAPSFTFSAFTAGDYTAQCVVSNGVRQATAQTAVTVSVLPPRANAGPGPRTMVVGETITLDGSHSVSPNGGPLTYQWQVLSGPVTLSTNATSDTNLTATAGGQGLVSLTVRSGELSSTARLVINVWSNGPSIVPVASAGQAQTVLVGSSVTLDGSASFDPDARGLTYAWTPVAPTTTTLSNASSAHPTYVPTATGTDTFLLVVTNDAGSAQASVSVTVVGTGADQAPTAFINPADTTTPIGQAVSLASASVSPLGHPLTAQWTWLSGPYLSIAGASTDTASVTAYGSGDAVVQLVVNDGTIDSVPALAQLHVTQGTMTAPTASTPAQLSGQPGQALSLDGSASSDPNGLPLVYQWTQLSGPPVVIHRSETAQASFVPGAAGTYTFALGISDWVFSASAMVTAKVAAADVPVAVASGPASASVGSTVMLNGMKSRDPMGAPLTFTWSQTSGPTVHLDQATTASPSFVPTMTGTYVFQLVVSNSMASSSPVSVSVQVTSTAKPGGGCSCGESSQVEWLAMLVLVGWLGRRRVVVGAR
jgi:PKD repeat protein